jgi:hypothetical protein
VLEVSLSLSLESLSELLHNNKIRLDQVIILAHSIFKMLLLPLIGKEENQGEEQHLVLDF